MIHFVVSPQNTSNYFSCTLGCLAPSSSSRSIFWFIFFSFLGIWKYSICTQWVLQHMWRRYKLIFAETLVDETNLCTLELTCHFISLFAGNIYYGPFMRLPRDCQELSICCLYYFSTLSALLLKSVALCCLCKCFLGFVVFGPLY